MTASTLSVAPGRITPEEEFTMIVSPAAMRPITRHASGVDLLVMRVSLALLLWARRRADRRAMSRESLQRAVAADRARAGREHQAALLAARVR
jgi:hypothetical protein